MISLAIRLTNLNMCCDRALESQEIQDKLTRFYTGSVCVCVYVCVCVCVCICVDA